MSAMVHCDGCGFHVEPEDVRERDEAWDKHCSRCTICTAEPRLVESYRRGFNAGVDTMKAAVVDLVEKSNLRRRASPKGGQE